MIAMEFTIDDSEYVYVCISFLGVSDYIPTNTKDHDFFKTKTNVIHLQVATATFYLLPKIKATRIYILNKYMLYVYICIWYELHIFLYTNLGFSSLTLHNVSNEFLISSTTVVKINKFDSI